MAQNPTETPKQQTALHSPAPHPHDSDWSDSSDTEEPVIGRRGWIRVAWVLSAIVVVVLLITLPPLVNVNRYQHRVTQAISGSIGRPAHFDSITLHLLPFPGFTIQNFVVQEDPAFGVEPAMRANVVEARVRFASLWRRRVEISRIRLEAPSVNLVRRADGMWNLQGVVTQASQLQSAPTAQLSHGDAPRFPYIEAKDARINVKQGDDKLPYSLVDAKFALWLPDEHTWKLRLEGRPLRTDTDVSDVGSLRVEATLGRSSGNVSAEPFDLEARLDSTPMGEAAKLVVGSDTGWRGAASADLKIHGTPATMLVTAGLHLHNLRRSSFVPRLPMSVDAHCQAQSLGVHQLHTIRCAVPTAQSTSVMDVMNLFQDQDEHVLAAPDVLSIKAEIPNTLDLHTASAEIDLLHGPPEWVLGWLRLLSTRIPAEDQVGGFVALHASLGSDHGVNQWSGTATCHCILPGKQPAKAAVAGKETASKDQPWNVQFTHTAGLSPNEAANVVSVAAAPAPSANQPATHPIEDAEQVVRPSGAEGVSGQISEAGYTLQYGSAVVARYAASLLPTLGDEMPADLSGPVQAERAWGATQTWTAPTAAPVRPAKRRGHR